MIGPDVFRVLVRNAHYQRLDELDAWLGFSYVKRFNDVGTWELEIARTMPGASLLAPDGGIIVLRNGLTDFSGRVASRTRTATTLKFSGVSDEIMLDTAARPTPSQAEGPFPDPEHVVTGVASTAMRTMVSAQIGPAAPATWQVYSLNLGPDQGLGGIVTLRGNYQTVLSILQEIAPSEEAGGLRFWLQQSDINPETLEFQVGAPRDQTLVAVFSIEGETAADYQDTWVGSRPNYFYVMAGDGFKTARTIIEGGDTAAILEAGRRITAVVDARGKTDLAELQQILSERIAAAGATRRVTITPQEVPSLRYGEDWDLGDIVTVIIDGEAYLEVVRSVHVNLVPGKGAAVVPTVNGSGTSAGDDRAEGLVARHLASALRRLSNLERNWLLPDGEIAEIRNLPNGTVTAVMLASGSAAANIGTAGVSSAMLASGAAAANVGTGGVTAGMLASGAAASNVGAAGVSAVMLASGAALANLGFTPVAIQRASYTGNGNPEQFISTGFTPQLVIVARTGNSAVIYLPDGKLLHLLHSDAINEVAAGVSGSMIAGGFVAVGTTTNTNAVTYYYTALG